jgi:hypothetical protein
MDQENKPKTDVEEQVPSPMADTFQKILDVAFVFVFVFASFIYFRSQFRFVIVCKVPGFKLHQFPMLNLTRFANTFGFELWTSLIGRAKGDVHHLIDILFPAIHLPNKQIRRSWIYRRIPNNISDFLNTPDVLWRSRMSSAGSMNIKIRCVVRIAVSYGLKGRGDMGLAQTCMLPQRTFRPQWTMIEFSFTQTQ